MPVAYRLLHTTSRVFGPFPIRIPTTTISSRIPTTQSCPPPSCPCTPNSPSLPDHPIDSGPLLNTAPIYFTHLAISTSLRDWSSRIEFSTDPRCAFAPVVKALQSARGRGLRDPTAPTLVTNTSMEGTGAFLFPQGLYIPCLPDAGDQVAVEGFVRRYLLPGGKPEEGAERVEETVVMICSHGSRDPRCGSSAMPLEEEFEKVLGRRKIGMGGGVGRARVICTSHLSGHKWAGNVVVYKPAGWGVWYGRVGTQHVEGIVDETVIRGRVIGELLRGVVGAELEE